MFKKVLIIFIIFIIISAFLVVCLDRVFVLITPPQVISFYPNSQEVVLDSTLIIDFDKPIKRQEVKLSISPPVHGEWRFENSLIENHLFKTLVFVPAIELESNTQYQVQIENIRGFGLEKSSSFQFAFKTEEILLIEDEEDDDKDKITMIEIALDWQDDALSCEAASLKMALVGKKVFVSEDEIMEKIGYDLTRRKGDVWGDPHERYVGDIDGKMCKTGYGVYWDPVAKAAQNWREAEAFSGATIEDLTSELKDRNPVVIWGVLPKSSLSSCSWYTPEGKFILAFKDTHVRLAIGFVGPQDNPSKIIINDPLSGRLYWSTDFFLNNWKAFNNSGVVIR